VLILADATANPDWIAADMLSQAEHDSLASAVCLVTDADLGMRVIDALRAKCAALPRAALAEQALDDWGAVALVPNLDEAVEISNRIAPEHLELMTADPWSLLPRIRHAGAVFLGHHTPEALGDYFAGPNHVLPTLGAARFSSALSVQTFTKRTSVLAASPAFTARAIAPAARLARLEALEAHARSLESRAGGQAPRVASTRKIG
jgi:histidinol dehydrogenase